jgi:hypothetical protein
MKVTVYILTTIALAGILPGSACASPRVQRCYRLAYHNIPQDVRHMLMVVRFARWHPGEVYWFTGTRRRDLVLHLANVQGTYVRKMVLAIKVRATDLQIDSRFSTSLTMAPNGRYLAYEREGHLSVYSLRRKTIRRIATVTGLHMTPMIFSPHGNRLVFVQAHHLYLYSLRRKRRPKLLFPSLLFSSGWPWPVTWVSRNTAVINPDVLGRDGQTYSALTLGLINLKTGSVRVLWKIPPLHGGIFPVAYSKSSHRLFFGYGGISHEVFEVATLRNRRLIHARKIMVTPPDAILTGIDIDSVSANGVYITYRLYNGRSHGYLKNIDTGRSVCFSNEGLSVSGPMISPGVRFIMVFVNPPPPTITMAILARVARIPVSVLRRIDRKRPLRPVSASGRRWTGRRSSPGRA